MTFKREDRYIVFKRKDLDAAAAEGAVDPSFAEALDIIREGLPAREFLVIESDWPEYEPVWRMIQARMEGAIPPAAQVQGEQPGIEDCLLPALRQYRHNDVDEFVFGYDREEVQQIVTGLQAEIAKLGLEIKDLDEYGEREELRANRYSSELVELRAALSAPPAAGVPWVMGLLDTGDWRLTRIRPNEAMTDEFNRRHSWEVERQMPPYSRERGLRSWFGDTPEQAFTEAINDLFPGRLSEFLVAAPTPPASEQQQANRFYVHERVAVGEHAFRLVVMPDPKRILAPGKFLEELLRLNPLLAREQQHDGRMPSDERNRMWGLIDVALLETVPDGLLRGDICNTLAPLLASEQQLAVVMPAGKLLVSAEPLRKVLFALLGAPHHILELQATRTPTDLFADNPINVLITEFNAAQGGDA